MDLFRLTPVILIITAMTAALSVSCSKNETTNPSSQSSTLRLPLPADPATLDPRQARDLLALDIIRLMFSGLTQLSSDGKISFDLAESIDHPDAFTYRIKLKKAVWSDASPITAHDFIYTWKSMLDKQRAAPNAFQLFWIRNAKAAYEGQKSIDEVGIRAIDDTTLEVDLEKPCPFFEQLLATPAFLAVQQKYDLEKQRYTQNPDFPISGPYKLIEWKPQDSLRLVKNPLFTGEHAHDAFSQIDFSILDDATAVTMVEAHKLDWAGSPMGTLPIDCVSILASQNKLLISPAAGTSFVRVNVTHPHLSDRRLREAISLVIDRPAIVEHLLRGGQLPAYSLAPPCLLTATLQHKNIDIQHAKELVQSYCNEKGCTPESLSFSLAFRAGDERSTKISMALEQDIKNHLGLSISLNPCDGKQLYARVSKLDYDMALGSWIADYFDAYSFYAVFERASNGTNNTGWENSAYQSIIENSMSSSDQSLRQQCFVELEQILSSELPVIPLYHNAYNSVKEGSANGISVTPLGYLDIAH
jgi:oligopeptide transport system substrate-binding protein